MAVKTIPTPTLPDRPGAGLEQAPMPMAMVEGAGHIVRYVNPAFCGLVGKTRDELLGRPFGSLLTETDECLAALGRVFRTGKAESHAEQERAKSPPVFRSYTLWPVLAEERPAGVMIQVTEATRLYEQTVAMNEALMLGSVRQHEIAADADASNLRLQEEIRERKRTEDQLKTSLREIGDLKAALDQHAIVTITDPQGKITYANDKFCAVSKYSREELLGRDHRMLKSGRHSEELFRELWTTIERGRIWHGELRNKAKDGSFYWVDMTVVPFLDDQGQPRQYVAIRTEITERKQTEEALRLAQVQLAAHAGELEKLVAERTTQLKTTNQQLEAFVYSIAHDLRAPLRAMQGFSQLLVEEAGNSLSETGRNHAGRISQSAQFMDAMLRDLLAFSRINQQDVTLGPLNLEPVVATVVARLQPDIQEKNAQLESPGPWPDVLAHEPTLAQVLFNLAGNALKFTRPGVPPVVRVRAEERAGVIRVWVEDNGVGIAPDHQAQIFRLFTRLHGVQYAGTGIGLAIVQKGVERMGGRVGVESAAGQGSRFWFELKKA